MSLVILLVFSACSLGGLGEGPPGLHLSVAEPDHELGAPVIELKDGTRFLESHVFAQADPGEFVEVEAWVEPGEPEPGSRVVIELYRSGGTKSVMKRVLKAEWPPKDHVPGQKVRLHGRIKLPKRLKPGNHWLTWATQTADKKRVGARDLPSGRVSLGTVRVGGAPLLAPPESWTVPEGPILVAGGDLMIGRRMNAIVGIPGKERPLEKVPEFEEADLAFANRECVVAAGGERQVDQGEAVPFYYRARPEMLKVLAEAGFDVVQTANNHGGDYGPSATLEQIELLAAAGVTGVGTGADRAAACAPVYHRAGDLTVAFFAIDFTVPLHQATETVPGSCYHDPDAPVDFLREYSPQVREARQYADIVLFGVHWVLGGKLTRPRPWARAMARAMIAAGADGVLGHSSHGIQGTEIVNGRPVIYDNGNLLWDSAASAGKVSGMLARLHLVPGGIARIESIPLAVGWGSSWKIKGNQATRALQRYRDLTQELGTPVRLESDRAVIDLPRPPDRPRPTSPPPFLLAPGTPPEAETRPPEGCRVDSVPEDARIEPQDFGPVRLLGIRLTPDELTKRGTVWSETWWTVLEPVKKDYWIYQRMVPRVSGREAMWWADHEHCDWMWPTSRWEAGAIYKDLYGLRPLKNMPADTYDLRLGILDRNREVADPVDYPGVTVLGSSEDSPKSPSPAKSSPQTR